MLGSIFREIYAFISPIFKVQVYFGRSLASVPEGSWIMFPYSSDCLYCGLIGILEYKRHTKEGKHKEPEAEYREGIDQIVQLWPKIAENGFKALMDGEIGPDEYLNGEKTLSRFEDAAIALKGVKVFEYIFKDHAVQKTIKSIVRKIGSFLYKEDSLLDKAGSKIDSSTLEIVNGRLILLKDCAWWLEKELIRNCEKVRSLIGPARNDPFTDIPNQVVREMTKVNLVLNNLDRLEIRGRDSAGISFMIRFPEQNVTESLETGLKKAGLYEEYTKRKGLKDFTHKAIVEKGNILFFCFKIAKELGRLGDNVIFLRDAITNDSIFHLALSIPGIHSQVIAHTRWASVGDITEANCHPLDNFTASNSASPAAPQINVVLNGDIDNYRELKQRLEKEKGIHIQPYITTDTKIIPLWVEHYIEKGNPLHEAFRLAVSDFKGSHAIALQSDQDPDHIYLAQKGSGQAIFIGIGLDCYIAASEVYGLVEQTPYYIKLDGEKARIPGKENTQGQIFMLDSAGGTEGISGCYYDGHPISINKSMIKTAQITSRDIDRQGFPHYYLKEISEAPESVRKTIRGKANVIRENGDRKVVLNIGEEILPNRITEALMTSKIRHIYLVGQGTAGVAAEGIAMLISKYLSKAPITVSATKASELSGFGLERSMSDTLVLAVTQSGTTTDTNKAVDLARSHDAYTMAIVNRRDSDITTKVDGVFYTSDGRDIEMSVASTKAFYSQIVAGCILGLRMAQVLGTKSDSYIAAEIRDLMRLPNLMHGIIEDQRENIAASANSLALKKRNWSVVGSGPNKVAADEIRIKLSELCYKTLPADVVEDRKHIDLSAEPLIIVCAAGNREIVLGDVIKDTAIFKAHQATVVCIATEGEERFNEIADAVFFIPSLNERMAPMLNTVAGHLWGYYVAKAINDEADFFRQFKAKLHNRIDILAGLDEKGSDMIYDREIRLLIRDFVKEVMQKKEAGRFDGALRPRTLCNLALACRYAIGQIPVHEMVSDIGPSASHGDPLITLSQVIDEVIDQMSRPIDAIKHQAKTVTVGTSRLPVKLTGVIFDMLPTMGFSQSDLSPQTTATLRNLQPAIKKLNGGILYHITGLDPFGTPNEDSRIRILDRFGVSAKIPSRVEKDPTLRGTKRAVVKNSEVYIGEGLWDKAQIIILPLMGKKEGEQYLIVFHITFMEDLPLSKKLRAMGMKYNDIVDMVTEWNITWDDNLIEGFSPGFLLTKPADEIAEKIRASHT